MPGSGAGSVIGTLPAEAGVSADAAQDASRSAGQALEAMPRLGRLGVKADLDREGLEIRETAWSAMRLRALGSASYCSNPPGAALVPAVIRVMCLSACPRRMTVCETCQIP